MKLSHFALVALLAPIVVQGQAPAPAGSGVEQACSGEIKQLCPGQSGHAAVQCLQNAAKSNPASVSSGCKSALQNAKKKL